MRCNVALFFAGGGAYCALELLYRGRTHWAMFAAGGLCLSLLWGLNSRFPRLPFAGRCLLGSGLVTGVELAFGLFCNRLMGWAVWDYSALWGNLWGQVCPLYSLYWLGLSAGVLGLQQRLPRPKT